MNDLTKWLFSKILINLKNHEGCTVSTPSQSSDSIRATIQDSLGFRYEVEIKCVGRITTEVSEFTLKSGIN